ncbi:DoxX family protein [Pseudoneobacillus sp. C159]
MVYKGGIIIYSSFSIMKLLRYVVAYVYITSGLMKLISVDLQNYFMSLGLPSSLHLMYIVAIIEIVCGGLLISNKWIRQATIPLIVIMIAAILLTKVPLLHTGFMHFAFNARLDIVMLVLLVILFTNNRR